jgi:hypothetical protein
LTGQAITRHHQQMREIMLDRSYYSRTDEIMNWCQRNLGQGGWQKSAAPMEWTWDIVQTFGYTTIRFRRDDDWALFMLTWM